MKTASEVISMENGLNYRMNSIVLISPREHEVLEKISYGYSSKEIATQLFISGHTVISHWKNLKIKMGARNAAELIRLGFQMGYLTK